MLQFAFGYDMIIVENRMLFPKIKTYKEECIMKKMKSLMRLVGIALTLLLLFTASACNTAEEKEIDTQEAETSGFFVDEGTVLCWLGENDNFMIFYSDGSSESYLLNDLERITWGYLGNPTQSVMPHLSGDEGRIFFETFFKNPVILMESSENLHGTMCDVRFSEESRWNFSLESNEGILIFTAPDGKQYVSAEGLVTFDQLKKVFEE